MAAISDYKQISQRDKAVLVGLFLSRFNYRGLNSLGFSSFRQAYNVLGYSIGILPKSIQNYRDEFDPYFPNSRKGWHNRKLRDFCKELKDMTDELSFDDFTMILKTFVDDTHIDPNDLSLNSQKTERKFTANRLITGKAAEEYFAMNYSSIGYFRDYAITNTTNLGCGFDYKLSKGDERYYVEVKGLNEIKGNILLTENEYRVADALKDKYCLFVVSNFRLEPSHSLFFDPLHAHQLTFKRHEQMITQVSYSAYI